MHFCRENVSIWEVWVDHGVSDCFMNTVSNLVLGLYLLIFGSAQLWMYKKYGTTINSHSIPTSNLYILQLLFTALLGILPVFTLAFQVVVLNRGVIYGFEILAVFIQVFIYPFSILLIFFERNYLLPSVPTRGHGLILLVFWTLMFISVNILFINIHRQDWWTHLESWKEKVQLAIFVTKYILSLFVFALGFRAPGILSSREYVNIETPMFDSMGENFEGNANYSTWYNLWKKIKILAPFLWPKKDSFLQLRVIFCFILLIAGRVINLYVPLYSKYIVNSIKGPDSLFRWDLVIIYVSFKFLQGGGTGGMGILNNLRSFLWIRVQQYTTREVEVELLHHLHGLSLRWHLSRKTGEVLRIMDRGTDSINNLLTYILFNILPTIVDIIVAVVYFVVAFNPYFGLIVFITMFLYILETICITEWRTKFQRRMNIADNASKARSVDSLLNFETVKYYSAERYEVDAFRESIHKFQVEEWKSMVSLNLLNNLQNVTICSGLLAGSLLCVYLAATHQGLDVGDYVLFAGYILQLYVPLNWFGTYYRAIQKSFVDMENMFDLLSEVPEVSDEPGAHALSLTEGSVEFKNVSFSYNPDRTVLSNISFFVPAGKTVALVGPSGSGKSTIIRLLFRFFDVKDGEILIDGQNIKFVKQDSLRRAIGVVPQDTVLFNNTIKYNIQYGRINAPDADIINAAKNADIHDRILNFPEAYDTQVGERGLKLSGGEKQRVAIARTLLKAPTVVLLDEATSALDTQTERNIQSALAQVCTNRTTIIVAHRLSTIIHADEILVLEDGEIIERGRHEDLITRGGKYSEMWQQQLKNDAAGDTNQTTETPNTTTEEA
ncbi:ATP-binding cassette sub-family B member 6, mitochondrial [Cimex lectularius]|uniref:ATP-binding cassette sub-family B member 6 n=1 Tax=Cimex lectularius TaxID=79782 RepID=A0A8I6RWR0_CIMLE|nr:ATP-binding cassette sub-family B member 6, mitochondrial [Cimex lectularius]